MDLTPPLIFSCTVIHRNSRKRMIGLSIVRRADGSLDVRVRQEVYDGAGTLVDADIAEITEVADTAEVADTEEDRDTAEVADTVEDRDTAEVAEIEGRPWHNILSSMGNSLRNGHYDTPTEATPRAGTFGGRARESGAWPREG
jgi:hypothetical protein